MLLKVAISPALTFQPTAEEFRDPVAYIQKIWPVAERYGGSLQQEVHLHIFAWQ